MANVLRFLTLALVLVVAVEKATASYGADNCSCGCHCGNKVKIVKYKKKAEIAEADPTPTQHPTELPECAAGWELVGHSCYRYITAIFETPTFSFSYAISAQLCADVGGYLAVFDSPEEFNAFKTWYFAREFLKTGDNSNMFAGGKRAGYNAQVMTPLGDVYGNILLEQLNVMQHDDLENACMQITNRDGLLSLRLFDCGDEAIFDSVCEQKPIYP